MKLKSIFIFQFLYCVFRFIGIYISHNAIFVSMVVVYSHCRSIQLFHNSFWLHKMYSERNFRNSWVPHHLVSSISPNDGIRLLGTFLSLSQWKLIDSSSYMRKKAFYFKKNSISINYMLVSMLCHWPHIWDVFINPMWNLYKSRENQCILRKFFSKLCNFQVNWAIFYQQLWKF